MDTQFAKAMSGRTDRELVKIVTIESSDYQPMAVAAAEAEIKRRNIDPSALNTTKAELAAGIQRLDKLESAKVSSLIRFIHFIIDTIAFMLIAFIVSLPAGLLYPTSNPDEAAFAGFVLLSAAFFAYYIFMESKYQKSLGKFITGAKVATREGKTPRLGDIVSRTFCRLIPFDRVSFLFTKTGFHDYLSNTIVVKDDFTEEKNDASA